jgi:hypothetical protein
MGGRGGAAVLQLPQGLDLWRVERDQRNIIAKAFLGL